MSSLCISYYDNGSLQLIITLLIFLHITNIPNKGHNTFNLSIKDKFYENHDNISTISIKIIPKLCGPKVSVI